MVRHSSASSIDSHRAGSPSSSSSYIEESRAGFCGDFFVLIRELFSALQLSGAVADDDDSEESFLVQNERGRFRLWGDGFDVTDGRLDDLLDGSSVLMGAVVVQFVGIARKLRRYVHPTSDLYRQLESTLEKAEYLFPEAAGAGVEDEDDVELTLLERLEDVVILNDGLYELTPFLEAIPIEYEDLAAASGLATAATVEATETKVLHVNILDKFPEASHNLALVERLAELNLRRKKRLWELKDKHQAVPQDAGGGGGGGGGGDSPSSYAPSSMFTRTTGSSMDSVSHSLLDLKDDGAMSEVSASSFATVEFGIVGLPPPPARLGPDVVFECNLCFEVIEGMQTKYQWKKHVFKDLQPYSCSFPGCPHANTLFFSRTDWIDHEFKAHRSLPEWVCITDCGQVFDDKQQFSQHLQEAHLNATAPGNELDEIVKKCERRKPVPASQTTICPLCREEIPETRKSIRRHIGRHMEEISLAIVPPENYNVDDDTEDWWESESGDSTVDENGSIQSDELDGPLKGLRNIGLTEASLARLMKVITSAVENLMADVKRSHSTVLVRQRLVREHAFSLVSDPGKHLPELCAGTSAILYGQGLERFRDQTNSHTTFDEYVDVLVEQEVQSQLELQGDYLGLVQCHRCKNILQADGTTCTCGHTYCPKFCTRGILSRDTRKRLLSGESAFHRCHQCKELSEPYGFDQGRCHRCGHEYCQFCPTGAFDRELQGRSAAADKPVPSSSGAAAADAETVHSDDFSTVANAFGPLKSPPSSVLSPDDGFVPVRSRSPRRSSTSRHTDRSFSSTNDAEPITRALLIPRHYYPRLIGANGEALSEIIVSSGGPVSKSAQGRMIRFPRQDSSSERVVITGAPSIVDGVVENMKVRVSEWEERERRQKGKGKGNGKEVEDRHEEEVVEHHTELEEPEPRTSKSAKRRNKRKMKSSSHKKTPDVGRDHKLLPEL